MNKNYFLIGTVIGLSIAYVVGYLIMGHNFHSMFGEDSKYNGAPPIFVGIVMTLASAIYFDKRKAMNSFLNSVLVLPAFILFFGSLCGSLTNFILNGQLKDVFSWFVKPMFWLLIVGIPGSLAIGSVYYFFARKSGRS